MASILPQCSWCGGELKENELRNSKEEILQQWENKKDEIEYQKKIKQHGEDVRKSFEKSIRRRI
ncbi:MAG: hypothetical protein QF731_02680 [Verrucomicrobiota bacterium]|nr:hypothetical protein [Verrucomicrobiota bacterium]MEE2615942.1 hypothetical protein [Verrucomicrobiota bacterium]